TRSQSPFWDGYLANRWTGRLVVTHALRFSCARTHSWFQLLPTLFMLLAATQSTNGEVPKKSAVTITPTRAWGNVFGDQEIEFKFRVDAVKAVKGKVVWRLAAGTATIKGGEVDLAANPNGPAEIAIKLPVPPVKDGIIFHTRLTLSALES